jgi:hypothetical protein
MRKGIFISKLFFVCCLFCTSLLLNVSFANKSYPYPPDTYFHTNAKITTNIKNICEQSKGQFVFKVEQEWMNYPGNNHWTVCDDDGSEVNYAGKYMLYFSIARGDGTGQIVKPCQLVFTTNGKLSNANRIVNFSADGTQIDSCRVYLS